MWIWNSNKLNGKPATGHYSVVTKEHQVVISCFILWKASAFAIAVKLDKSTQTLVLVWACQHHCMQPVTSCSIWSSNDWRRFNRKFAQAHESVCVYVCISWLLFISNTRTHTHSTPRKPKLPLVTFPDSQRASPVCGHKKVSSGDWTPQLHQDLPLTAKHLSPRVMNLHPILIKYWDVSRQSRMWWVA